LNPTLFVDEGLKFLKSITITTDTSDEAPDLRINSIFEIDIETESREYKRILQERKPGPPIKDELFHGIEDKHKTLSYGIVKYIGWRNNLHIDQLYSNVKESIMNWEFNGVSSSQQPKPQFGITSHYELVRSGTLDLSGTDIQHFYKLYDSGLQVPIHQELLTEVNSQLYSFKSRSTYLLLYTALEVATKTLIKTLKPETDYLISKMQSPDLYSLYTQYINTEISSLLNDEDAKTLKKMATVRNNIAHRGEGVTMDVLQRHYNFVSSLIKKIERVMGYV
jgi:uncharacterized protein YutE (UPF0331/DUF86 family)